MSAIELRDARPRRREVCADGAWVGNTLHATLPGIASPGATPNYCCYRLGTSGGVYHASPVWALESPSAACVTVHRHPGCQSPGGLRSADLHAVALSVTPESDEAARYRSSDQTLLGNLESTQVSPSGTPHAFRDCLADYNPLGQFGSAATTPSR